GVRQLREVHNRDVHALESAREHEGPEVELVGVDADAPDVSCLLGGLERAKATSSRHLEDRPRALLYLPQCNFLALGLIVERQVVRVTDEHLHLRVGALRTLDVPADEADDRGDGVRPDRADDLGSALALHHESREVADEKAGLVLGEDDARRVLRLRLQERVRDVHSGPLGFRALRSDRVLGVVVQEADGEDHVVARPARRPWFASWLNERSWIEPMSVTMAILKVAFRLAEPAALTISAVTSATASATPTPAVRPFTCPPYE